MSEEKRMGFLEHLEEIRTRLIISIIAILITTALAYVFSDAILRVLEDPASSGGKFVLYAFSPMDGFMIRFRVALYGGIALAAPVWIYQILRFIEPGLLPNEKRFVIPGVAAMVILFLLGNGFGYLMLRNMMSVLFVMFGSELNYFPSADQYISFVVYFLIATGIAFELPILMLLMIKLGLVSPQFLRKQRRYAYFVIFLFAELITPVSDPIVAPLVVMIPMVLLFEAALFLSKFMVPKPAPSTAMATSTGARK
ncbi:MAG: twin-arginine translocase subunit TatC [Chloroflexi bacterium]|nr:twin-arginine translocase subunit TatC [Chloroflexota bacterium]